MPEWKIITRLEKAWVVEGNQKVLKDIILDTDEQIDKLGNVFQRNGGVIPKKCQGCEQAFEAVPTSIPIKENVPIYTCQQCPFKSNSAEDVWNHKVTDISHVVAKTSVERIIGEKVILVGKLSKVNFIKDKDGEITDCQVACQSCLDSGKVVFA